MINVIKKFAKVAGVGIFAILSGFTATSVIGQTVSPFVIINADDAGVGLNDATPTSPVGRNSGRTVGEQRLIALNYVGLLWNRVLGPNLPPDQKIEVLTRFLPLACNVTQGALATAGPLSVHTNFANARFQDTLYPAALANKLARVDVGTLEGSPGPEIGLNVNVNVGSANCLAGGSWYYGLDDKAPAGTFDFVKIVLHEYGHGLGFLSFADETTGELAFGFPSVWEHFLFDGSTKKLWVNMNDDERKKSAQNNQFLAWNGPQSIAAAKQTLQSSVIVDVEFSYRTLNGLNKSDTFATAVANYGPGDFQRTKVGRIGLLNDIRVPGAACSPLIGSLGNAVRDRIAVIDRGGCDFITKTANAQAAGAIAVIFVNNQADFFGRGAFAFPVAGVNITIPSIIVRREDGASLRDNAGKDSGAFAVLREVSRLSATDRDGRPLMFAPSVVRPGSSVSHWDITAIPNLLMEPTASGNESVTLLPPRDLTFPLLRDIGW
jgi:hypothetical protein